MEYLSDKTNQNVYKSVEIIIIIIIYFNFFLNKNTRIMKTYK